MGVDDILKRHALALDKTFDIKQPLYMPVVASRAAASPSEADDQEPVPQSKRRKQTPQESSYLDSIIDTGLSIISPVLSGLGYLGSSGFDAILGRRMRAGIAFLTGQGQDKNRLGELFTIPFISDAVGWTDRRTQVTGSDLLGGWDDPDTVVDGVAEFAVEMLTDPLSFLPGAILGAAGKGGKIVKSAGFMDEVTKGLTKKLGRPVGRHEAKVLASLKDATIWSNGGKGTNKMSATLKKKWDDAAVGQGYKDIDDALTDIGSQTIGGRIGVTWNPLGEAIKTYGTGEASRKYLAAVDSLGRAVTYGPIGTKMAGLFDNRVRDALTPDGQERMREIAEKLERDQYEVRLRNGERLATLSSLGLDKPQYRDSVVAMAESSVRRAVRNPDQVYEIAADDRRIRKIIKDNLENARHPDAADPTKWVGYGTMKEFIKDLHDELSQELLRHNELGLGNKEYTAILDSYITRSTRGLPDPTVARPPKFDRITRDMERRLTDKGMTHQEIYALDPNDAAKLAYGAKIARAAKRQERQLRKGKFAGKRGGTRDTLPTSDETMIRRQDFLKNAITKYAQGSTAADMMVMDTRISGPLSDYARNGTMAANLIFSEHMGHNPALFKKMNAAGRYKKGMQFGDLAGLHPHALNKQATDAMTKADARILNDSFTVMKADAINSHSLADYLRELDPRYAFHQLPLFFDDLPSRHMKGRLAATRTHLMAQQAHKLLGDGMYEDLARGQGPNILASLAKAGFSKKSKHRLTAFLKQNKDEIDRPGSFYKSVDDEIKLLEGGNPHNKLPQPGDTVVSYVVNGKQYDLNAAWVDHHKKVRDVLFKYGATAGTRVKEKASRNIYKRLRAEEVASLRDKIRERVKAGTATPKMEAMAQKKYEGLRPSKSKLAELTQRARRKAVKLTGDNLSGVIRQEAYDSFVARGGKVMRVAQDVINDARKSMDLSSDPDVTRGFLGIWDKLTNVIKTSLTSNHIPYFLRNLQGLGIMDYVYGADSSRGIRDYLSPARAKRFYGRWKDSVKFHAGEDVEGMSDMPYFKSFDWKKIADEQDRINGGKTTIDKAFKDKVATEFMRTLSMASEAAPPHRSSEVMADRLGLGPMEASSIAGMMPGKGANKITKDTIKEATKQGWRKIRQALKPSEWKNVDWSFLNPLAVRGGFAKFSKASNELGQSQNLMTQVGEWANDYADRVGRTASWMGFMKEGLSPVEAAMRSNAMHVDYNKLSNFERKVARRLIPFYTFQRRMTSYFLRDLAAHPGRATANMIRAINVSTGEGRDKNKFTPQQLAGQLAIPLYRKGNVQSYLRPDLPIEVLNDMVSIGPDMYSTFQNTVLGWGSSLHFIPKAVIETAFGKSTFQKGRRLEDMYSRIGSKDPILNQIVMASPLSRYINMYGPRGVLFDDRKTALEKASTLIAGVPISSIDMDKAARETIRDAISREVRTADGVALSERYYVSDDDKVSERAKQLVKLQDSLAKRQRAMRKKVGDDAKKNEAKRASGVKV